MKNKVSLKFVPSEQTEKDVVPYCSRWASTISLGFDHCRIIRRPMQSTENKPMKNYHLISFASRKKEFVVDSWSLLGCDYVLKKSITGLKVGAL